MSQQKALSAFLRGNSTNSLNSQPIRWVTLTTPNNPNSLNSPKTSKNPERTVCVSQRLKNLNFNLCLNIFPANLMCLM